MRHAIFADEGQGAEFGLNQIDEVTEQEGIDVSAVTIQSMVEGVEETACAMDEGVKKAVARKQRNQMWREPLKEMLENAVVVQEEVIEEIIDVMNTEKEQDPPPIANA